MVTHRSCMDFWFVYSQFALLIILFALKGEIWWDWWSKLKWVCLSVQSPWSLGFLSQWKEFCITRITREKRDLSGSSKGRNAAPSFSSRNKSSAAELVCGLLFHRPCLLMLSSQVYCEAVPH